MNNLIKKSYPKIAIFACMQKLFILCCFVLIPMSLYADSYSNTILSFTPKAYWRFDETSGSTATDLTGNGYHGTYAQGIGLGYSGVGSFYGYGGGPGAQFINDATSSDISFDNNAALKPANITITGWFNPNTVAGVHCIFCSGDDYWDSSGIVIWTNGTSFQCRVGRSSAQTDYLQLSQSNAIQINTWHHYAFTYDDTTHTTRLYLNGTKVQENIGSIQDIYYNALEVNIGSLRSSWYGFSGTIDDTALYDYALSESQVASLYAARFDPDLDGMRSEIDPYPSYSFNQASPNNEIPNSGLKLWLDISDSDLVVRDTSNLTSMVYDKSSNDYPALILTASRKPAYSSGVPSLVFSGDDYMVIDSGCASDIASNGGNGMTAFYVSKSNGNIDGYVLSYNSSSGGNLFLMGYGNNQIRIFESITDITEISVSQNSVYCVIKDPNDHDGDGFIGHKYLYQDGYLLYKKQSVSDLTDVGRVSIGQEWDWNDPSDFLNGEISEVIIYNRVLSDSERVQVSNYLANKWNSNAVDTDADGLPDTYDGYDNDPYNNARAYEIPTANLKVWIDGNDPVGSGTAPADGTVLNRLVDKSGNGLHLYQSAPNACGRYQTNGYISAAKGCVDLTYHDSDDTNDSYYINYPNLLDITNQATWIMVLKPVSDAHSHMLICNYDNAEEAYNNYGYYINLYKDGGTYYSCYSAGKSGSLNQISVSDSSFSKTLLLSVTKSGASVYESLYKNEATTYLSSSADNHSNTSTLVTHSSVFRFGGGYYSSQYLEGYLGELLIFDAPLTESELLKVHNYLNRKWNIIAPTGTDTDLDRVPDAYEDYDSDPSKVVAIPSDVDHTGLALWLDGSDTSRMYKNSNYVHWLFDKSGQQHSASQINQNSTPIFNSTGLNSSGTFTFSMNNYMELEDAIDITSNWTVIALTKFPKSLTGVSLHSLIKGTDSDQQVVLEVSDNDELGTYITGPGFSGTGYKTATELNGWNILSVVGTGDVTKFFIDDKIRKAVATKSTSDFLGLGNRFEGDQPFGEIAEIFIYTKALSDYERRKVERYIINKWALDKETSSDSNLFGF